MIDSLRIYDRLKAVDLPDPQAKAIAQAIGEASEEQKARHENALAAKVNNDTFGAVIERLEQKFDRLEKKLDRLPERAEVEAKIAEAKSELLRWMFGFWVGQVGATIAIIKLLR